MTSKLWSVQNQLKAMRRAIHSGRYAWQSHASIATHIQQTALEFHKRADAYLNCGILPNTIALGHNARALAIAQCALADAIRMGALNS